jgi:ribosomal subunit interface protein
VELRITGRHAHLGADVTDYANEKLGPLSRYYDRTRHLEVVFDENHLGWKVEAIAHLQRGTPLVATVHHKDARAAIDLAHDKLERLLTKEKDKRRERRRREAGAPVLPPGPSASSEEE